MVTELQQKSEVHLVHVIQRELNGKATQQKPVPSATMLLTTVMYISCFYMPPIIYQFYSQLTKS